MTVNESTIASIDIEGRTVDVDVVAPTYNEWRALVAPNLPNAYFEVEDDDELTMAERVETAEVLINACTNLPPDLIEQLPMSATSSLTDAVNTVMDKQMRHWERQSKPTHPSYKTAFEFIYEAEYEASASGGVLKD